MRRREGSGEKELRGATAVILARMASREGGWKRVRSWRLVIRRVFVGGVGWERGGRLERSRDRVGREEVEEVHERFALKEGNSIISFDFGVVVVVVIIEVVVVEVVVW